MSQEAKSSPVKKHPSEEFPCKWAGCASPEFPTLTQLVNHVTNSHLNAMGPSPAQTAPSGLSQSFSSPQNSRYTCLWEGCARFSIEQPSRFALISHCRTHTGEKPYFCPIPECEKHFTRSDALAKHVKGVHDLHQHRDAIALLKHRSEHGKASLPGVDVETLADDEYAELLHRDYELRVPWWFSQGFQNAVSGTANTLEALYERPLETRAHDVAAKRYRAFLGEENAAESGTEPTEETEELISEGEAEKHASLAALQGETRAISAQYRRFSRPKPAHLSPASGSSQQTYEALRATLATAGRVHRIVKKQLDVAVAEKRRLWVVTQALLDANIKLGLSTESDGTAFEIDPLDEVLLADGTTGVDVEP